MAVELKAMLRDSTKKSLKKQLRREGKIPGIVYGKTIGNQNVAIEEGDLVKLFHSVGLNEVIQLDLGGKAKTSVMAKDLQKDPLKNQLIHVDFKEINMNEEVEVEVPLHIKGEEGVEKRDGVVQLTLNDLHVRALPGHIPSYIEIDVTELQIGDSVKVDNLKTAFTEYEILNEDDEVLVTINHPQLIPDDPVVEDDEAEIQSEEKIEEANQENTTKTE